MDFWGEKEYWVPCQNDMVINIRDSIILGIIAINFREMFSFLV